MSGTTADHSGRVDVAAGVDLHVLRWSGGDGVPFVLVHGLASNARLWDGVAAELAAAGHPVVALDQRGHGRSARPDDGYDMATVTDDLRAVVLATEFDRPVVVGQSWGGNVVVELAARFPGLARATGCVDGGAIELSAQFPDWDTCVDVLRPPPIAGTPVDDLERMLRSSHPDWPESGIAGAMACFDVTDDGRATPWLSLERHLQVLRGLWDHRPTQRLPLVAEPVLFVAADDPRTGEARRSAKRGEYDRAVAATDNARVEWMVGDHDLHAQHPVQVASLLRSLAD